MMDNQHLIRNFCIIAHIDHGKSTLADRMLELTNTVPKEKMQDQMLDRNPIERERGITIKLQPVRMFYYPQLKIDNWKLGISNSKQGFVLNLIDTPGHVDFNYEVSRSLAAVEGAILLIDASKGVQAQTLANLKIAQELNLKIIPVINKIDLPHAEPEKSALEAQKILGCEEKDILFVSGKTGEGVEDLLQEIVKKIPPPKGLPSAPLRALVFDSVYDKHKGVVVFVRVVDGNVQKGEEILLMQSKARDNVLEVGYFSPDPKPLEKLEVGNIGYIVTGLKDIRSVRVGETVTISPNGKEYTTNILPLEGYIQPKPMVYASVFPVSPADYPLLRDSIERYSLTDASVEIEPENSPVLGFGYRLGFLGLLHIEIVVQRLDREYNLDLIITTPQVKYEVEKTNNETIYIHNAINMPDQSQIKEIKEPWSRLSVISPSIYLGNIMELVQKHRCENTDTKYLDNNSVIFSCDIPLSEIIINFYDELKSVSKGYASMNYDIIENRSGDLVKLDVRIADDLVNAFSSIIPEIFLDKIAREKVQKLKEVLPRQQFEVKIQALVGSRIIASERISPLRKDVTAKLYRGDVTRKRKLLEKQKKGKSRLRKFGKVDLPSDVFIKLLKK